MQFKMTELQDWIHAYYSEWLTLGDFRKMKLNETIEVVGFETNFNKYEIRDSTIPTCTVLRPSRMFELNTMCLQKENNDEFSIDGGIFNNKIEIFLAKYGNWGSYIHKTKDINILPDETKIGWGSPMIPVSRIDNEHGVYIKDFDSKCVSLSYDYVDKDLPLPTNKYVYPSEVGVTDLPSDTDIRKYKEFLANLDPYPDFSVYKQ